VRFELKCEDVNISQIDYVKSQLPFETRSFLNLAGQLEKLLSMSDKDERIDRVNVAMWNERGLFYAMASRPHLRLVTIRNDFNEFRACDGYQLRKTSNSSG